MSFSNFARFVFFLGFFVAQPLNGYLFGYLPGWLKLIPVFLMLMHVPSAMAIAKRMD